MWISQWLQRSRIGFWQFGSRQWFGAESRLKQNLMGWEKSPKLATSVYPALFHAYWRNFLNLGALNCWWISDWSLMIGSLAKRSTGMSSKRTLSEIRRTNSFQILNSDVTMRWIITNFNQNTGTNRRHTVAQSVCNGEEFAWQWFAYPLAGPSKTILFKSFSQIIDLCKSSFVFPRTPWVNDQQNFLLRDRFEKSICDPVFHQVFCHDMGGMRDCVDIFSLGNDT